MIIGYARVSTDGQTLDAQQSALKAAGAEKAYAEKISSAIVASSPKQSPPLSLETPC
jgi:DNA invertase Pin-like site-specific DNA recombinase